MKILIIEFYILFMAIVTTGQALLSENDIEDVQSSIWTAAMIICWLVRLYTRKS